MGQASRLRLALRAGLRAVRVLFLMPRRGSSGRMGMPTTSGGGGGSGAGVMQDMGGDKGGATRAGVDEGELLLVRMDDAARAAAAFSAVCGHGRHVREGGRDEAVVVAVSEVGGGEGY